MKFSHPITVTLTFCVFFAFSAIEIVQASPKDNLLNEIHLQARGGCMSCMRPSRPNNNNNPLGLQPVNLGPQQANLPNHGPTGGGPGFVGQAPPPPPAPVRHDSGVGFT